MLNKCVFLYKFNINFLYVICMFLFVDKFRIPEKLLKSKSSVYTPAYDLLFNYLIKTNEDKLIIK